MRTFHPDTVDEWRNYLKTLLGLANRARETRDQHLSDARTAAETLASYEGRMADLRHLLRQVDADNPDYSEPAPDPVDERARRLADWRRLLDYLEAHPELPIGSHAGFHLGHGSEAHVAPEEVEAAARLFGAEVETYSSHITTRLWFDDTVALKISADRVRQPDPADEPPCAEADVALLDAEQAADAGQLPSTPSCGCEEGESCVDCAVRGDYEAEAETDAQIALDDDGNPCGCGECEQKAAQRAAEAAEAVTP